jgi:hypothetical protein
MKFEQFALKESIKSFTLEVENSDVFNSLTEEEIIEFVNIDECMNEGLLSAIRDKIKALIGAKKDVEGEGSTKKKEIIQKQVDLLKDKAEQAKEDYAKKKEDLESKGFVKTDQDRYEEADSEGFPKTASVVNPDGKKEYWIMSSEKTKEIYDKAVKQAKDAGMYQYKPGEGGPEVPDPKKYDSSGPINTPKGNTIFFVKKKDEESSVSDKVQEIDDKINSLMQKQKSLNKKIEDEYGGDSSDPGAKKAMSAIQSINDEIKKLQKKKENIK